MSENKSESEDGKLYSSVNSELDLYRPNLEDYLSSESLPEPHGKLRLRDLIDISPALTEAAGAIVDDSFTRCFKSNPPEPWNWNIYLFPLWCCGVVVRYLIIFPIRVLVLTIGWIVFLSLYMPVHFLLKGQDSLRKKLEVFVANHTSMIDFIILEQMTAFA
ncbi:glycerol-3-phosphate acyltransferase 9-like isoform X2 [Beta vulgaris subsp. vulgaris]|uniref:glycerol-3-phosphate acyltransferase 9-like isoform X2 n=1 Tax=Beta vulgaris subsp. vulgaris TaxID=3555 RepID=UPI002036FBB6|nr:glycerol-3-phosphate acyltransferase 9-like isoform X2 [Beta vulgaris subsp. vulgaris]